MERISYGELPKGMYQVLVEVENYIHRSGLDLRLVELLKYRVSQLNHCAYCLDMHYKEALHMGEEPLRLYSVAAWRECPYYSEQERAALEFAEALTDLPHEHIDDALFENMQRFFNKQEISLLTLVIAQINTWNRIQQVVRTKPGEYKVRG
ncbi:carboxymuconolactone decarboxylase family protein [Sinomicrobium pectinilyticum]|uniref:Carboxymuconolactone decarboxylase family protein n=1 Tax=Sinomicrobium pectinilyticum TaxID=1084421 RepID=A0A3N0ECT2_SINP1|nr:carboxymuconolactone decarboxylase family protein [Sinomicrobium pectinilyticum]RNL85638.1 carboxymuconolactone decarboxylase family protein [Sinomicrobium pectinilyticum]